MAKQFNVEINGVAVPNVLDVEYGLAVEKDKKNGAPTDARPRIKSVRITRRSDESTDYWTWALQPYQEAFRSGKIEVMDPTKASTILYTLEWESGFVQRYQEVVPDVQQKRDEPQKEILEVSARTITVNGVVLEAEWEGAII